MIVGAFGCSTSFDWCCCWVCARAPDGGGERMINGRYAQQWKNNVYLIYGFHRAGSAKK